MSYVFLYIGCVEYACLHVHNNIVLVASKLILHKFLLKLAEMVLHVEL